MYLNTSESNVPKHLKFRAFTLIPLKKKKHLRVLRGLVIIHMCIQKRDLAVSKPHVLRLDSLDSLYMTLDIPANASILLALTFYFMVLAYFPFTGAASLPSAGGIAPLFFSHTDTFDSRRQSFSSVLTQYAVCCRSVYAAG